MYSCADGSTSFIVYGDDVCRSFEFKLPVVKQLNASKMALLPIKPSLNRISMFLKSSELISSGHPPCAKIYALAWRRMS